jgi:hypothetical protein
MSAVQPEAMPARLLPRTDDEKYSVADPPSTMATSRGGESEILPLGLISSRHADSSAASPATSVGNSDVIALPPVDDTLNHPSIPFFPRDDASTVPLKSLGKHVQARGPFTTSDAPEVVHEMEVSRNIARAEFTDGPEVVHEASGVITAVQPRLVSDTPEPLFDDDEETRAIQAEQARLHERRGRLMELERIEDEERRLKQKLEERRMRLRGQR